MARLEITHDRLKVTLYWWEKLAARRSHLTIPLRTIREVTCVPDAKAALGKGKRTSATHIPGWTYSGTMTRQSDQVLALCHGGGPGIVLDLHDATYGAIVISTRHAKEYADQLAEAIGVSGAGA